MKILKKISYNSPVVLTFALISLGALGLSMLTKGASNKLLFCTYRSSLLNPLTYIRMFTHVLGHSGWAHYANNMVLIMLVGPMLEEKYGSRVMLQMILVTSFVTALLNAVFFPHTAVLGASGIVFMFILLSSFATVEEGKIPLTLIFALVYYIGNEMFAGITVQDNISHASHIIGGGMGCVFGWIGPEKLRQKYRD